MFFVCNYSNFIQYCTVALRSAILGNFCERVRRVSEAVNVSAISESLNDTGLNRIRYHYEEHYNLKIMH